MNDHPSLTLASFAAQLDFDAIPTAVVERTVNLYVDWLGSALAGKGARPVETIARFARQAGGGQADDPCEILINRTRTTPYFAAMVNRIALRRAGRCAQRLGISSGDGGVPGSACAGAGEPRVGA
jgi:2-methylcitrate dehydratase PrpD